MTEQPQYESKQAFLQKLTDVKQIAEDEFERYTVVKDETTSKHYLRYHFIHYNLGEGGHKDSYDYFLPLDSDDVLGLLFGEEPYRYPEHWKRTYVRTGNDDRMLAFDPTENFEAEAQAEEERALLADLLHFKEAFANAQAEEQKDLTRQFLASLDEQRKQKDKPEVIENGRKVAKTFDFLLYCSNLLMREITPLVSFYARRENERKELS